jgi:hypothetical protein
MFQENTGDEEEVKYILVKTVRMGRAGTKSRAQTGRILPTYLGHTVFRTVCGPGKYNNAKIKE